LVTLKASPLSFIVFPARRLDQPSAAIPEGRERMLRVRLKGRWLRFSGQGACVARAQGFRIPRKVLLDRYDRHAGHAAALASATDRSEVRLQPLPQARAAAHDAHYH
jgi:hypothetical protein